MSETHFNIQIGDVDGDGKQDVTVSTGGKKIANFTIYDVKRTLADIGKIIVSVLVAMGILEAI